MEISDHNRKRTGHKVLMAYIFEQMSKGTQNVLTTLKGGVKKLAADAASWFKGIATSFKGPPKKEDIKKPASSKTLPKDPIGRMYSFVYDPKTKDTLPYYDTFPLVFPVEIYNDGFLGVNMHYLPPMYRARLMNALYTTLNNKKFDDSSKLNISYSILKASSRLKLFEPCLKRYLSNHIRSNIVNIPIEDWDKVVMLPTQQFQKASAQQVWKDSLNKQF